MHRYVYKCVRAAQIFGFSNTNLKPSQHYNFAKDIPADVPRTHWNLFMAINSAIDIAL